MKKILLSVLSFCLITSLCYAQEPQTGSDRDAHGCITSAGYTWSQLKKDCIRPFEQSIRLQELHPAKTYTTEAAVILDEPAKLAEIFVPGIKKSILLKRTGKKQVYSNGKWVLEQNKAWLLRKNNKVVFASGLKQ